MFVCIYIMYSSLLAYRHNPTHVHIDRPGNPMALNPREVCGRKLGVDQSSSMLNKQDGQLVWDIDSLYMQMPTRFSWEQLTLGYCKYNVEFLIANHFLAGFYSHDQ